MELISDLKRRLHEAEIAMYNSEYPSEFSGLLQQTVFFDGRDWTWEEMLDKYPEQIPTLRKKGFMTFSKLTEDFATYASDMARMRISHFCPFGDSWKEFVKNSNNSSSDYNYNDNYSCHEVL